MPPALLLLIVLLLAACGQEEPPPMTVVVPTATAQATAATPTAPAALPEESGAALPSPTPAPAAGEEPAAPVRTGNALDPTILERHRARLHPDLAAPDLSLLPHYVISATVAPPSLRGTMSLSLPNDSDEPLPDVLLRLYGNAQTIYSGARLTVSDPRVNGEPVEAGVEVGGTALRIPLPEPLEPGDRLELALDFESTLATGSFRGYGIQQVARGIAVYGSPFPILALRDGADWRLPTVPAVGDAVSSPVALWDLHLTVPGDLTLVSTGETVTEEGGRRHIASGPARDVALVALPATARPIEQEVAGVRLRYWPAAYVTSEQFPAADAAMVAARALESFAAEFGPPPYRELDVIEAEVPIGGYEYPGLVLFDGERRAQGNRDGIDFLVPHEIAHQWFYALLGNDVTRAPWIDEGLATYAQLRYLARVRGADAATAQRQRWADEYAQALARQPVGVDRPLFEYGDWVSYRGPAYYASALLFDDLRQRLGDEGFREAIRRLLERFAFGEATTADLRATFDEVAAERGLSLADFWPRWLE